MTDLKRSRAEQRKAEIREAAEADFETFVRLVHPMTVMGAIHVELCFWMARPEKKSHQIILLPRDHAKSRYAAYYTAWRITKNPAIRVLYISSTANLAVKQLKFIKDILTCDQYRKYWPEMVNEDDQKREKWTESEISVDHPLRKAEAVRDPTIFTAGLTTNVVGMHCDLAVYDDVVTNDTAYTEEGRAKIETQYSLLASVESGGSEALVVGTRYHPKDLYNTMLEMRVDIFDEDGEVIGDEPFYESFRDGQCAVENVGDGSGEFLWPRQQRKDGKWFGFDAKILAKKRAQYIDKIQFRAQYYNDPNDYDEAGINRSYFQYYERDHVHRSAGRWYIRQRPLNVYAAIDFAYSMRKEADYSAIVVVGVDADNNYYILEIDRFKTKLVSEYFAHILALYKKWQFTRIKAEVTAAQDVIVTDLKQNYIRRHGLALIVEDFRPTGQQGTKEERIFSILQPKYSNRQVWHYHGGYCQTLEEELVLTNPPHDDIKDCLATAMSGSQAPTIFKTGTSPSLQRDFFHPRFGGMM